MNLEGGFRNAEQLRESASEFSHIAEHDDEWILLYDPLETVTVYYYSESQPSEPGLYWHYVNGRAEPW